MKTSLLKDPTTNAEKGGIKKRVKKKEKREKEEEEEERKIFRVFLEYFIGDSWFLYSVFWRGSRKGSRKRRMGRKRRKRKKRRIAWSSALWAFAAVNSHHCETQGRSKVCIAFYQYYRVNWYQAQQVNVYEYQGIVSIWSLGHFCNECQNAEIIIWKHFILIGWNFVRMRLNDCSTWQFTRKSKYIVVTEK